MVENEAEQPVPDESGSGVLQDDGDRETVPVGEDRSVILVQQMEELAALLREYAGRLGKSQIHYDANKALLRSVDHLQRFVNEYERDTSG